MPEREKQDQVKPERTPKIVEQDPKDIPQEHQGQSQVNDVNPGKVQPGHRDREQI
jgi:hypothetical protein